VLIRQTPITIALLFFLYHALLQVAVEHGSSIVCPAGFAAARGASGHHIISAIAPPSVAIISPFKLLLVCLEGEP